MTDATPHDAAFPITSDFMEDDDYCRLCGQGFEVGQTAVHLSAVSTACAHLNCAPKQSTCNDLTPSNSPADITTAEIEVWARKQDRGRRNPRNSRFCLYTGPDGSHCIVGQFLVEHGYGLPPERRGVSEAPGFEDTEAAGVLAWLQEEADLASRQGLDAPWGMAIDAVFGEQS